MASKRLAGVCYIKVDGEQIEVSGGLEAPLSKTKKEAVQSAARTVGFKETPIAPYVKVTGILVPGFPKAKLESGTDMTVTAEFANGDVYTLSGAWFGGESAHKGDDGTAELEFGGTDGEWKE
ncbi:phage tail tube protein [Rhodoferax sp. TS-BS-61-7]|uniref:phage tail tube protein n=1 Tax=Rhodoferax sp. TS-BS-61-7 TaxID=2094194 RepID=UPI000CF6ED30|nr:phage tail tube protein [Rhodoferax sp. TS-BS-61-7]PQA78686.1 phage tail protein [Rhodoferax sp. TS-BS-61-7]